MKRLVAALMCRAIAHTAMPALGLARWTGDLHLEAHMTEAFAAVYCGPGSEVCRYERRGSA